MHMRIDGHVVLTRPQPPMRTRAQKLRLPYVDRGAGYARAPRTQIEKGAVPSAWHDRSPALHRRGLIAQVNRDQSVLKSKTHLPNSRCAHESIASARAPSQLIRSPGDYAHRNTVRRKLL